MIELPIISLWMNLPGVSNSICFSVSKTLFRHLSLDCFSNLGNICPQAVCYYRGLCIEREISCRLKVQAGFGLVFNNTVKNPSLSQSLFTSHSPLEHFVYIHSPFWLISVADDLSQGLKYVPTTPSWLWGTLYDGKVPSEAEAVRKRLYTPIPGPPPPFASPCSQLPFLAFPWGARITHGLGACRLGLDSSDPPPSIYQQCDLGQDH